MTGKQWWWCGLTNEDLPKGQRAIGAVVVLADEDDGADSQAQVMAILRRARLPLGIVGCFGEPMDPKYGNPPPDCVGVYLDRLQAEQLAKLWCGGFASPEQIEQAFLDDEAKVGEPLFKVKP